VAAEERLDFRADLRRLDARRDLADLVRRFDRELLMRRRLEVVGDFFLVTRETPIGAIIAHGSKVDSNRFTIHKSLLSGLQLDLQPLHT